MRRVAYNILAIIIIIAWLPFSIPLIVIGSIFRLSAASVLYGYDETEELLRTIMRGTK